MWPVVSYHWAANRSGVRWFIGDFTLAPQYFTDHKLNWWSVEGETDYRDSLLTNSMKTSWSVDGETDCRDSLLKNSMQTSWSVDGETDCRDSLLTNSMQTYGR